MKIKTDTIYDHDSHGEVLVSRIAQSYNEWDSVSMTPPGPSAYEDVNVHFYTEWDQYGGMPGKRVVESVDVFSEVAQPLTETTKYVPDKE